MSAFGQPDEDAGLGADAFGIAELDVSRPTLAYMPHSSPDTRRPRHAAAPSASARAARSPATAFVAIRAFLWDLVDEALDLVPVAERRSSR